MHTQSLSWKTAVYKNACKKIADILTPTAHDDKAWARKNYWLRKASVRIAQQGVAIEFGFVCLTGNEENIVIDAYAAIGQRVTLWNFASITIGKFAMIAADVTMTNGGHDKHSLEPFAGPLTIGHGCWIGHGARIIGPLTIGKNVIVGAGSLVLKDIPDNAIVAGVPAKIIGMRDLPEKVWHLGGHYFNPHTFERVDEHADNNAQLM